MQEGVDQCSVSLVLVHEIAVLALIEYSATIHKDDFIALAQVLINNVIIYSFQHIFRTMYLKLMGHENYSFTFQYAANALIEYVVANVTIHSAEWVIE